MPTGHHDAVYVPTLSPFSYRVGMLMVGQTGRRGEVMSKLSFISIG